RGQPAGADDLPRPVGRRADGADRGRDAAQPTAGPGSAVLIQAQWAQARDQLVELEIQGEKLAERLIEAERALGAAQERGLDRGIEVNGQRVTTFTERLDRLRGRWRELRAQEGRLRSELHVLG